MPLFQRDTCGFVLYDHSVSLAEEQWQFANLYSDMYLLVLSLVIVSQWLSLKIAAAVLPASNTQNIDLNFDNATSVIQNELRDQLSDASW